jgi:hypothetical protein
MRLLYLFIVINIFKIVLIKKCTIKEDETMSKIYVPVKTAEEWRSLLAEPEKHWETGCSAKSLAHCWQDKNDFPKSIEDVFSQYGRPFENCKSLLIFPEHKVPLDGGIRPSQNDVWILAKSAEELISITVEGKVNESFDKTIGEWMKTDGNTNKPERLDFLKETLGLDKIDDSIRYQLLYRTASALIEAERFNAKHALMLVHSFSQENNHFNDYVKFVSLFTAKDEINVNSIVSAGKVGNISLYFGWVKGEEEYLSR